MQPKDLLIPFDQLHKFSCDFSVRELPSELLLLWNSLETIRLEKNFPAVTPDVGQFFSFFCSTTTIKHVFEFGSGYGHSAFWYLSHGNNSVEKIVLTERRDDLEDLFHKLPWPESWYKKLSYYQGDAFDILDQYVTTTDLFLIDGEKASYLNFIQILEAKCRPGTWVIVDNAFWRGSFLDESQQGKSAVQMREFHRYIQQSSLWQKFFFPFSDGLLILQKN